MTLISKVYQSFSGSQILNRLGPLTWYISCFLVCAGKILSCGGDNPPPGGLPHAGPFSTAAASLIAAGSLKNS